MPSDAIVRISDPEHLTVVSIATDFGNIAYSMTVRGVEILYKPAPDLDAWRAKPGLGGVPLLSPWANRIDGDSYWANGKKYTLNPGLGNFKYDGHHLPIHGLVSFTDNWRVVKHDNSSVTSRLEPWKEPDWMAQFPFAHTIEVTHRLHGGALEVATTVENLSHEPMPLSLGYHPYFQLSDSPRDDWKVHLAARESVVLSDLLVPTGERKPIEFSNPYPLAGHVLDNVFTGLTGAEWSVEGKKQKISVKYGPKFPVAVVYAPKGGSFVCFEPMASETNAFNLTHEGKDASLQMIAPGVKWSESFFIAPTGF
jgi:aldose 1-epimerase